MAESLEFRRTVADVRLERILYVLPEMTLAQAAERLASGYRALVVTGVPHIFTDEDLVRALGSGLPLTASVSACDLDRPLVLSQRTPIEQALHLVLEAPERCAIVVDDAHDGVGRLTLRGLVVAMLSQPPWAQALQLAVHPHEATLIEFEL